MIREDILKAHNLPIALNAIFTLFHNILGLLVLILVVVVIVIVVVGATIPPHSSNELVVIVRASE